MLLASQGASPYRVHAYRDAAVALEQVPRDVREIYDNRGLAGLDAIPHVGLGIATAIAEMLTTHRWAQLDRLRGTTDPAALFQAVPGMGPQLARLIHERLRIDTLEGLEAAANDGRLEEVPGVGPRRVAAWRAALDAMLRGVRSSARVADDVSREPAVEVILDVDREYREKAQAGTLHTIAPRRFNPENEAWLPILHVQRGGWHFTALFSNTALAHRLERTRDWVVVYFYDGDHQERQRTVVTESHGALKGRRTVRGREPECADYYLPAGGSGATQPPFTPITPRNPANEEERRT